MVLENMVYIFNKISPEIESTAISPPLWPDRTDTLLWALTWRNGNVHDQKRKQKRASIVLFSCFTNHKLEDQERQLYPKVLASGVEKILPEMKIWDTDNKYTTGFFYYLSLLQNMSTLSTTVPLELRAEAGTDDSLKEPMLRNCWNINLNCIKLIHLSSSQKI